MQYYHTTQHQRIHILKHLAMRAAPIVSIAGLVLLLHVTNASSLLPLSSEITARAAADPAAIENADSDAVAVAAASAPAADAALLEQSTYSLRMQQNRRVAMNSESSAYLNADNTRAADNELLTTYIKDQTQTPFGTIFTENLHVIYGVAAGVMLLAIVILAVMLVRKNRAREQDYPEEEPLLRESIDQVDAFLNDNGEQEEMDKALMRQRKMADDLKKQAGMIMSRGNNQLDDQLCDADISSNYPARKEEQERHALLEAATTILESTASLEKERERTRSAAVAARAFEQHLLVARLATENERKQKDLLVAHAEQMKQHHKTEVERQREAALAAERRHKKVIDDANKQREILKAKEEEHTVMLQQQHETELERQKAAAALAIEVAAQKERERLKTEDDQRLVQLQKDHEQRIQSANEERATLLKAAEDDRIRLTSQYEEALQTQREAAEALKTGIEAERESIEASALNELVVADETAKLKAEHAAQLVQKEQEAAAALAVEKFRIAQLQASDEEKAEMLSDAEEEKRMLIQTAENEKALLMSDAKERMSNYVELTEKEKERLERSHAELVEKEKKAVSNLIMEKKRISKLQASDAEKIQLLQVADKEKILLTKAIQEEKLAGEAERARLVKSFEEGLKAALDKERALAKQREIQIEKQAEAAKHELVQVQTKVQAEAKSLKSQLDAAQAEASLGRQKSMTEMSKLREEAVQAKAHAAAEKERRDQAELAIQLEKQKSATAEEKATVLEHKHAKALNAAAQAQKIAAEERQKSQEAIALAKKAMADHEEEASRRIREELALEKKKIEDERALEKETSRKAMEREVNNDAEAEASRLKKRRPSFRGSLLTKSKVVDTIGAIFEKKARADSFNLTKSKPRVSLLSSTRDFFVQMYGSIARDRRVAQFRHSVLKHKATSLRIQWFATLIGWNEDQAFGLFAPFRAEAIHAFIDLLLAMFPMDGIEESLDQDPCMVNLDILFLALGHQTANAHDWTTGGMSNMKGGIFEETYRQTESFEAMVELLITSCVEVGSSSAKIPLSPAKKKKKFLEFEFVMDVVLREWYKWKVPSSEMGEEKASGPSTSAKSTASLMVL